VDIVGAVVGAWLCERQAVSSGPLVR
jgi:hypothetical protein